MPDEEKKKLISANAHIPTDEIEKDIRDTEAEIALAEKEIIAFEAVPIGSPDARISHMKASARRSGIAERKEFIRKLRIILESRDDRSIQMD